MDDELVLSVDSVLETTLKNSNATFIKMTSTTFCVPPSEFLGDKEERRILQWFITHKSKFLREQNKISKLQGVNLSDAELKEVEVCLEVFAQQQEHDEELFAQINEV